MVARKVRGVGGVVIEDLFSFDGVLKLHGGPGPMGGYSKTRIASEIKSQSASSSGILWMHRVPSMEQAVAGSGVVRH